MKSNVMLLISNFVIVMLLNGSIAEVYGSSTIFQCYDETVYMESPTTHEMLALFTIRVGISIQTEPDGTWKENSIYQGEISVTLEWYDSKLFPYGICLEFPQEYVHLLKYFYIPSSSVNETILYRAHMYTEEPVNFTLNEHDNFDYYEVRFMVGEASSFSLVSSIELAPRLSYYVYNFTIKSKDRQIGGLCEYNAPNCIYIPVKEEEVKPLSEPTFQDFSDKIAKALDFLQSQIMLLDVGVIILLFLLFVTIYYVRKRRPMVS